MPHEPAQPLSPGAGPPPEPLSSEVLKLKIDDLFQEVEHLKRRVERLEGRPGQSIGDASTRPGQMPGTVSDPDRHP